MHLLESIRLYSRCVKSLWMIEEVWGLRARGGGGWCVQCDGTV